MNSRMILAAGALAAALGGSTMAQAGDIVWARDGDIDSLDPHRATSTLSRMLWYQIYDALLEFSSDGDPIPNLAREWSVSDGGREVVFHLREGIVCHDGSAFTAEDVKWTAERALSDEHPSITKASWGPITAVDVVDDLTVRFSLSEPFGAFVPFMADEFAAMLCKSNADDPGFGVTTAIGTGPWKLVSWTKGSEIVLARNDDYVNVGRQVDNPGPPQSDRLIVRTMPEGQTRVAGLRTGELHVIAPPIEEVETLQADPGVEIHVAQNTGQNMFLQFSAARAPFNDARARQAVAHAIDVDLALDIVFGDLVQRERCPVAVGVFGHDEDFCAGFRLEFDPDRSRALLAELGHGPDNPMPMIIATWTGDSRERMLQVFQNQLQQVGINASIEVMDIGTLNARVKQENNRDNGPGFMDLMGWTWFDPDVLYLLWHSPGAYDGYNHPELDALLQRTRTTVDPDARREVVQEVFGHLLSEAVHVPVYTPGWLWIYAASEHAQGFTVGPFDRPIFEAIRR